MRLTSAILMFFFFCPILSEARTRTRPFELDTSVHTAQPLSFKGYRVITPKFHDRNIPYYFVGKNQGTCTDKSLASQITTLLSCSACSSCGIEDTLFISIQEFKFYDQPQYGEVMSLFFHSDYFNGKSGCLHHI